MTKIYFLSLTLFISLMVCAQTTIDISAIDAAFTSTVDDELVIDVATASSAVAAPLLSYDNPFKGQTFVEAEISFNVFNYHGTDSIKVLGSLLAIFDGALGRMYFSNGSYLGYNDGNFFDANMLNFGLDHDFIGGNEWKNIKLQFTATGFAMYVDDVLAYDQNSTDVAIGSTDGFDYGVVIPFLQNASTLVIGTGSWWSDNTRSDGTFWDAQFSYLKNIKFTPDFSTATSIDNTSLDNGELIGEEFYSITGVKAGSNFQTLKPGIYIRSASFSNGAVINTKIGKTE